MASHGLFDIAVERSSAVEIREGMDDKGNLKKSAWLSVDLDFWLYHESGASYGPILRHIQVVAGGAQSYASAQSFAEKYFLRNLFKVPTGDVDEVDASQQVSLPASQHQRPSSRQSRRGSRDTALMELGDRRHGRLQEVLQRLSFWEGFPWLSSTRRKILAAKKAKKTKETLEWVERGKGAIA